MEVAMLSDFRLDPRNEFEEDHLLSSQSTITEPSPATTPRPRVLKPRPASTGSSQTTTTEPSTAFSPVPAVLGDRVAGFEPVVGTHTPQATSSSQASTVETPWTPKGTHAHELRQLGIDPKKVPYWFVECYESDGYDTDALVVLARTAPLSPGESTTSSPGFELVGDTNVHSARDEWVLDKWPLGFMFLESTATAATRLMRAKRWQLAAILERECEGSLQLQQSLRTRATGNKHAAIDTVHAGGKVRLMNHSCKPAARFHEVQTGRHLSVVAVTVRDVYLHRDIQHLNDMPRQ
ncbi:hypothetical protein PPTG_24844 [Phytophthora nicotianae INRA-310]|uniref:SET domain-containing protein n=1 Tax=Phytophthora nicotianae (strain INRA-310) TaxID=761204 RepID=W2PCL0_PHYN3|nr:hypothetical protein PPTG_24844 [Phytophthora nicotianae INRA-310]ETM97749.1 hypothetical protein PPTG_24844 [Phytophthora nicotianae INRA-310]